MCGICGVIYRDPRRRAEPEVLSKMASTLRHRGPDGEGVKAMGPVGLGHRRLSVIDLSEAGTQPMPNEDESVWIVYNGETYNYQSLRRELTDNHQFRSQTDTEAILHLYEERGFMCVNDLNGMFAIAIVDLNKNQVVLARDPFGIKPLYYSLDGHRLVFGSELKSLVASGEVAREIDHDALNDYFDFQWIPAPRTIYKGVRKLEPAHVLTLDIKTWEAKSTRYWKPEYRPHDGRAFESWQSDVSDALEASVRQQLVSDVALGSFLSGGIDSSLVSLFASRGSSKKLASFTVDFEDETCSERGAAEKIGQQIQSDAHFETLHHESIDRLSKLVHYYDEPFADSSLLPTTAVSAMARKHVTVALSGDGGDELFSGYKHHNLAAGVSRLDRVPATISKYMFGAVAGLAPGNSRFNVWGRRFALPPDSRRMSILRLPGAGCRTDLLAEDLRSSLDSRFWQIDRHRQELAGLPPVTQVQLFDLLFYLPNDMLVKVDRASMASSLEVRVPFLSRELADLAFQIPEEIRFQKGQEKRILRGIAAGHFGTEFAQRPKRGFAIPRRRWMTEAATPHMERTILSGPAVADGVLDRRSVQRLFRDVRGSTSRFVIDRTEELFTLVAFHHWWQCHMSGAADSSKFTPVAA